MFRLSLALVAVSFTLQLLGELPPTWPPHNDDSRLSVPPLFGPRPAARGVSEEVFATKLGIEADPKNLDWKSLGIDRHSLLASAGASLAAELSDADRVKARNEQLSLLYSELNTKTACPSDDFLLKVIKGEVDPNLLAVDKRVDENFDKCLLQVFKKHLESELAASLSGEVCLTPDGMKALLSKAENHLGQPFFNYMAVKQFGAAGLGVQRQSEKNYIAWGRGRGIYQLGALQAQPINVYLKEAMKVWISDALDRKLSACSEAVKAQKVGKELARNLGNRPSNLNLHPPEMNSPERANKTQAKMFLLDDTWKRSAIEAEKKRLSDLDSSSTILSQNYDYALQLHRLLETASRALNEGDEMLFKSASEKYDSVWKELERIDAKQWQIRIEQELPKVEPRPQSFNLQEWVDPNAWKKSGI
jgi:hypothetical protein